MRQVFALKHSPKTYVTRDMVATVTTVLILKNNETITRLERGAIECDAVVKYTEK